MRRIIVSAGILNSSITGVSAHGILKNSAFGVSAHVLRQKPFPFNNKARWIKFLKTPLVEYQRMGTSKASLPEFQRTVHTSCW